MKKGPGFSRHYLGEAAAATVAANRLGFRVWSVK
jgi:hypothetical protein